MLFLVYIVYPIVCPSVPQKLPNSPALSERDSSATHWRGLSLVCQFHDVEIARVEIKHCGFTMWVDLDDDPSCSELHMPGTPSLSLGNVEFPDRLLYILEEVVRFTNKTGDGPVYRYPRTESVRDNCPDLMVYAYLYLTLVSRYANIHKGNI